MRHALRRVCGTSAGLARISQCAVKSAGLQWEKSETEDPPGNFRSAGSSWSGEVQQCARRSLRRQRSLLGISEQAGRKMNEHRASLEKGNANADPVDKRGRLASGGKRAKWAPSEFAGVGVTACWATGVLRKHGKPVSVAVAHGQLGSREGQTRPMRVTERLVVAMKPGNAGGAKGPQFKGMAEEGKTRRLA